MTRAVLALTLLMTGCASTAVLRRLETIEARLAAIEQRPAAAAAPAEDPAAAALLRNAQSKIEQGETAEALTLMRQLVADHPGTRSATSAQRMIDELSIVGQPSGDLSAVTTWLQGSDPNLTDGRGVAGRA